MARAAGRWDDDASSRALEVIVREPESGDLGRPPLLFVHGISSGAWAFDEHWLPRAHVRGWTAAALSLRGHGNSPGRDRLRVTTLRDYAHDVIHVVETLPRPPVLIGHAMGALVVRQAAQRVELAGMALLAPTPAHGAWRSGLQQLRHSPLDLAKAVVSFRAPEVPGLFFAGLPEDRASELLARMGPESPLAMTSLLRPRRFQNPKCPVAVFGADQDRLTSRTDVEHTARAVGVSARWLSGIGHEMMLDAGAEAAIDGILDWVDAAVEPPRLMPGGAPA